LRLPRLCKHGNDTWHISSALAFVALCGGLGAWTSRLSYICLTQPSFGTCSICVKPTTLGTGMCTLHCYLPSVQSPVQVHEMLRIQPALRAMCLLWISICQVREADRFLENAPRIGTLSSISPSSTILSTSGTASFPSAAAALAFLFGVDLMPRNSRFLKKIYADPYMSEPEPLSGPFWPMKRLYEFEVTFIAFWNSPTFISLFSIRARILRLHVIGLKMVTWHSGTRRIVNVSLKD
jgi:hypothetical protein